MGVVKPTQSNGAVSRRHDGVTVTGLGRERLEYLLHLLSEVAAAPAAVS